jgi:hypothetical protein
MCDAALLVHGTHTCALRYPWLLVEAAAALALGKSLVTGEPLTPAMAQQVEAELRATVKASGKPAHEVNLTEW